MQGSQLIIKNLQIESIDPKKKKACSQIVAIFDTNFAKCGREIIGLPAL
jgi:hypothetical protein